MDSTACVRMNQRCGARLVDGVGAQIDPNVPQQRSGGRRLHSPRLLALETHLRAAAGKGCSTKCFRLLLCGRGGEVGITSQPVASESSKQTTRGSVWLGIVKGRGGESSAARCAWRTEEGKGSCHASLRTKIAVVNCVGHETGRVGSVGEGFMLEREGSGGVVEEGVKSKRCACGGVAKQKEVSRASGREGSDENSSRSISHTCARSCSMRRNVAWERCGAGGVA